MIFNENLDNTNLESLLAGIKNYSVMTDQFADNLHDLEKVAQHNLEIANQDLQGLLHALDCSVSDFMDPILIDENSKDKQ